MHQDKSKWHIKMPFRSLKISALHYIIYKLDSHKVTPINMQVVSLCIDKVTVSLRKNDLLLIVTNSQQYKTYSQWYELIVNFGSDVKLLVTQPTI